MNTNQWLGIDELLDNDMTSYEFYNSLSPSMQKKVRQRDFGNFAEMKDYVARCRNNKRGS